MLYPNSTYNQAVTYLFLGVYLCCTLSIPIFEGVHFLLHLGDNTQVHSFQSHQSLHDHQILVVLNDLMEGESSSELPTETPKKIKFKKLVQISDNFVAQNLIEREHFLPKFGIDNSFYKSPFLQISAQPPEV